MTRKSRLISIQLNRHLESNLLNCGQVSLPRTLMTMSGWTFICRHSARSQVTLHHANSSLPRFVQSSILYIVRFVYRWYRHETEWHSRFYNVLYTHLLWKPLLVYTNGNELGKNIFLNLYSQIIKMLFHTMSTTPSIRQSLLLYLYNVS